MGLQTRQKLSSLGPNFASTPQARQAPSMAPKLAPARARPKARQPPGLVVSDAGPLISLGRLDLLQVLPALFAQVQVPQQVMDECLVKPGQRDTHNIQAAVSAGWLHLCGTVAPLLPLGLELGETAAISRALEIGAGLLADDQAARNMARANGLDVIGTLGVLVLAKRAGLVGAVAALIENLRSSGQRLSQVAIAEALTLARETAP